MIIEGTFSKIPEVKTRTSLFEPITNVEECFYGYLIQVISANIRD